ncbi:sulfatase-like hydrolase/transferase [bacterium]|nr:sulfatase-like hydrolase/transferase [bacterium]
MNTTNTRRDFLKGLSALSIGALAPSSLSAQSSGKKPNILWIMSDDHAAHAIGAYGGRLASLNPTPTLDRLAREGMRFHNVFCTNSICVPSRATLMTGQYSHTNGVRTLNDRLDRSNHTLSLSMQQAGYQTAMIGKWHLKVEPNGFDYYCVLPGQGSYFNPILREKGNGEWPNNERRFAGYDCKHCSDVVTDLSLNWLKKRENKPFFLMHHFKAPHDNFENAERYDWLYGDTHIPEPLSLWKQPNHGSKATEGTGTSISKRNERRNMGHHMFVDRDLPNEEYTHTAYQRYLKKYLRTVRGVDDNIARLVAYLEQTGELDNTIILYTSDQGFMLGEHDYIDKRWMYEESLRVPFIVRYPKTVKAGSTSEAMIDNTDFAPTLLDLAGVKVPDSMQGRSFRPILEGNPPADWKESTYYRYWMHMAHHDNPAHYGLRTKNYKLIFFYGLPLDAKGAQDTPTIPGWELYDLRRDPKELHNVYDDPAYKDVREKLKAELQRKKQEIGDMDEGYPALMEVRNKYW